MTTAAPPSGRTAVLRRRIRWVVAITITWNVVEAGVALIAGAGASSAALIGFGLDSVVEVLSAAAVAWQFAGADPEAREQRALRIIAASFFVLAAYVGIEAILALAGVREADPSTVGIVLAALSLIVMPFLSWFERRTGRELGSASAVADSKQTLICSYLSAALLVGLVLNAALGWRWADSVAALLIAVFAVREGREALRGDACCVSSIALGDVGDRCSTGDAGDACSCDAADESTTARVARSRPLTPIGEVPVACTLTPDAGRAQVERWRRFTETSAQSWDRQPGALVIHYTRTPDSIRTLEALVATERRCCAFVGWRIDSSGRDLRLIVEGTPDQLRALSIGVEG